MLWFVYLRSVRPDGHTQLANSASLKCPPLLVPCSIHLHNHMLSLALLPRVAVGEFHLLFPHGHPAPPLVFKTACALTPIALGTVALLCCRCCPLPPTPWWPSPLPTPRRLPPSGSSRASTRLPRHGLTSSAGGWHELGARGRGGPWEGEVRLFSWLGAIRRGFHLLALVSHCSAGRGGDDGENGQQQ